jgi:hypothetical protein
MGKPVIVATLQEAWTCYHHCLEGSGEIVPAKHFRDELRAEDLDFEDAWVVLKTGNIYDSPEVDIRTGESKFRIEGHEPGGKWICIVFSFKAIARAFLITIFSVERKGRTI